MYMYMHYNINKRNIIHLRKMTIREKHKEKSEQIFLQFNLLH